MDRLKGLKDFIFDMVEETTNLVERTHTSVWDRTVRRVAIVQPLEQPAKTVQAAAALPAAVVYATIRGVNRGVQQVTDAALGLSEPRSAIALRAEELSTPMRSDAAGSLPWVLDHAQTAMNGVCGDYLSRRRNTLALGMSLRHQGRIVPLQSSAIALAYPRATPKLAIFVHGLSCTEWSWTFKCQEYYGDPALHFGTLLESELGYTPMYVRYNTGRHVSENGSLLNDLIRELLRVYPVAVEDVVLIGHSMGGLVARSAAQLAANAQEPWGALLTRVFCLGSPHLGAPLEKAANVLSGVLAQFDAAGAQVPAELLNARSDGVKDLRFGYTVDEEWKGRNPDALLEDNRLTVPLVDTVEYYFLAATLTKDPAHPWGRIVGDILVRLPSAAGYAAEPSRRVPFRSGRVFGAMNHFHLASHPDVYRVIRGFIQDGVPALSKASAEAE